YNQALTVDPNDLDCHYNRGGCLVALERYEEAISAYQEVLFRDPEHLSARLNQAYLLHRAGKKVAAIAGYRKVLEHDPEHQSAAYMLAALTGDCLTGAPHSYIREVFNQFSDHYEKHLVESLSYRLPEKLLMFVMRENPGNTFLSMLDLGCGTGLIGIHFKHLAEIMHGVDLSEKMIEKARQKGIYEQLHSTEIGAFLASAPAGTYDLLIAADVFAYIGKLEGTFAAAYRASTGDALFCFSVEDLPGNTDSMRLQSSGRFAHSRSYIENSAASSGRVIRRSEQFDLRLEGEEWIPGCVYTMCK
ncbi:MAG: tetratricopeptide repeat protein, partial [Desulfofustis sp.]|nr:tetratricopeptide repeat protein [Desulfofustis sp.]